MQRIIEVHGLFYYCYTNDIHLHVGYTALLLRFRVNGVQPTQAQPIQVGVSIGAPPSGVAVYLTTVPLHLVILRSDQLTPSQPWSTL